MLLIKSVLIPRICYGVEVFGHKYSNLHKIRKIVHQAIKESVGRSNVCISAVMQEFNIMPIEAFAKYMQIKSIDQETGSYGELHYKLFENRENIVRKRGINRTRMQETQFFMKRYRINLTEKKEMKKQVRALFEGKKAFNPANRTNEFRAKYKCTTGRKLHYQELDQDKKELASFLIAVRLNTVNNARYLARCKLISEEWADKCLLCRKETYDEFEHWFLNASI